MYNVHLTHSLLCFEFVELTLFSIFALANAAVAACGKHGAAGAQRNDARSQGPQWATARGRRRRGEGRNDIYKQQHWLLFAFKKKPEKLISEATGN